MHICVRINSVMLYNNTSYLKLLTIVIPSKDFVVVTIKFDHLPSSLIIFLYWKDPSFVGIFDSSYMCDSYQSPRQLPNFITILSGISVSLS